MKTLILTIVIALTLISCQATQKECKIPDPYRLVAVGNNLDPNVDVYIGVGEINPANEELYTNEGLWVIEPIPFMEGIRALIEHGMLCKILGHNFGHGNECMICGEERELDKL